MEKDNQFIPEIGIEKALTQSRFVPGAPDFWKSRSQEIDKLALALSRAQAVIENAAKDKANPFFKSQYADLASVWGVCRKPLTDNGLSVIQEPSSREGKVSVTTTLLHSSGQYTRSTLEVPVTKQDAQGYGSAITYVRRYQLQSIAGVAPAEDDGNAASAIPQKVEPKLKTPKAAPKEERPPFEEHSGDHVVSGGEFDGKLWKDLPADYLEKNRFSAKSPLLRKKIEAEISRRDEEAWDRENNFVKEA